MNSGCPDCGNQLEEIMINVLVASTIVSVGEGGDILYGDQSNEDGEIERYQCTHCGYSVPGVTDSVDLYNFLRKNGYDG